MIATVMLTALVASLLFTLAAYCAERGLHALSRPTRVPWIIASMASIAVPIAQLVAWSIWPPAVTTAAGSAQALPLTTILTFGAVERLNAGSVPELEGLLIGLWVCASFVALVRLFYSGRALRRLQRSWKRGEVAGVRTWISDTYGPAVVGVSDPEIVIPRRIADLPMEEQRLAVAHELEHIAARDQWLVRGAALAAVATPWNLCIWLATRRLRNAIEIDCDARVLREKPNVSAYASLVLNVASWPRESPVGALALSETAFAQLERRLRIMTTEPNSRRLTPAILSLAGALALAVTACEVAVSVERPDSRELRSENVVHMLPTVTTTAVTTDKVYFEFQVEKPVTIAPESVQPRYPQILRQAGVEGGVLVEFVVDADGRADVATFKALKSSHDLFVQSVQSALPQMRYIPAEIGGKRVKQLVQQPFAYSIAK